jgi:predicted subunit of tRNA(5-methylaminomethyl-2-thiouridylate) methyltransferase
MSMKAAVLYSGGKDSSFMAVMLKRLGLDVELCTANFGVYDSYVPASKSAASLGFDHKVLNLDIELLEKTCDMIMKDGFPNDGIKFIHENVVERVAEKYDIIADGTRRDDRTPKLTVNQIRSLEDRKDVQYINLDSFGHKTVKLITSNLFEISHEKSNRDNSSDYEVEIRTLIDERGGNSLDIFPEHYQTRVIGYKK